MYVYYSCMYISLFFTFERYTMGLLGLIFTAIGVGIDRGNRQADAFLQAYSGGSGGWGLERFNSIVKAHSDVEGIIERFDLDEEGCEYPSLDGYENCWTQAWEEEMEKFIAIIAGMDFDEPDDEPDPEDLIDRDTVDAKAHHYAKQLAEAWLSGEEWIPEEVMDWAWYELSGHNV